MRKYPTIYFNEYFKRKPSRLAEHGTGTLFTLEKTDENNFEYVSVEDHEAEIAQLRALLKQAAPWVKDYELFIGDSAPDFQLLKIDKWFQETENM